MSQVNGWYFNGVEQLPREIRNAEWEGKEVYTFRRVHEIHGVMWINVIASDGNEARKIIEDVTK